MNSYKKILAPLKKLDVLKCNMQNHTVHLYLGYEQGVFYLQLYVVNKL